MTERPGEPEEEQYAWIVVFHEGGKVYTYAKRSVPEMTKVALVHHKRYGVYPFRMWAMVDYVIQKVEINDEVRDTTPATSSVDADSDAPALSGS